MSKNGWQKLKQALPAPASGGGLGGRPRADLKQVLNAIFYVVKTGCSWRSLPHDFPCWETAYGYFSRWSKDGTWEFIHCFLVKKTRERPAAKPAQRSAAWTHKA